MAACPILMEVGHFKTCSEVFPENPGLMICGSNLSRPFSRAQQQCDAPEWQTCLCEHRGGVDARQGTWIQCCQAHPIATLRAPAASPIGLCGTPAGSQVGLLRHMAPSLQAMHDLTRMPLLPRFPRITIPACIRMLTCQRLSNVQNGRLCHVAVGGAVLASSSHVCKHHTEIRNSNGLELFARDTSA